MSASITSKGRKQNLSALINYATEAKKTTFEEELLITGKSVVANQIKPKKR